MGSSASNVKEGAPVNPRLLYTENLSKNNNKPLVLDTPVLIDVDHGSIRYRYGPYKDEPVDKRKRVERPYGGSETVDKKHYFYHARVKKDGEEDFKRVYVAKGPTRSKDKFIYYVYGKGGFEGQDGDKVYPSQNKLEDKDYAWPANRNFNDLYYEVSFPLQEDNVEMIEEYNEEDNFISELESTPDKSLIKLLLHDTDTALNIKSSLAIKLLKAASNIHIYYKNKELRNEDVISDLRDGDQSNSKIFQVQLSRK